MPPARDRRRVWLFDLDDTLHDARTATMPQLHVSFGAYIQHHLQPTRDESDALRRRYWTRYGATLLGLVRHHGVSAAHFLHETHRLPGLEQRVRGHRADLAALARLRGRKVVLTNAPAVYAERVLGVATPRVGLVSNGEEETKGNELAQAAYPLLKAAPIHFVGNVEGKDVLLSHAADVVVTDGFTGNVIIKFAEAIGKMMREIIKEEVTRDPVSMLGGVIAKGAFNRVSARADDSPYGGAVLLGVDGIVIIGHGRAKAEAVTAAIRAARRAVAQNVVANIAAGVKALPQSEVSPA